MGWADTQGLRLSTLQSWIKPFVKNHGVIIDRELRLDKQINSVVRTSFSQLRLLSKIKSFLLLSDLEKVIHAFITSRLDYCNALYVGVSQDCIAYLTNGTKCRSMLSY